MTQSQGQTQNAQNAQQSQYPANEESGYNETQGGASAGDTQTHHVDESWRPTEARPIEQAGGTTQATEGEPGRSQQDGKAQGTGDDTVESFGQGAGSSGV